MLVFDFKGAHPFFGFGTTFANILGTVQEEDRELGSHISTAAAINSVIGQMDTRGASSRVVNAIQSASSKTGVNFSYLMQKASQESSFNPTAKATTSSATGLFQFTGQTWLHMVKTYGEQYGLGDYAAQIQKAPDGKLSVSDPAMRQEILALRKDPQISSEMAAELDKENAAALERKVGGKIGATELYLAHFLGANGASRFIREMRSNPATAAADLMPTAAAANKGVFYTKLGEPRSLQEVYQKFAQKFDVHGTQLAGIISKGVTEGTPSGASSFSIASLMPTDMGATEPDFAGEGAESVLRLQGSQTQKVASLGIGSSLFDAMIMGQLQDTGLAQSSPSEAFGQYAANKRKNAYSSMSYTA